MAAAGVAEYPHLENVSVGVQIDWDAPAHTLQPAYGGKPLYGMLQERRGTWWYHCMATSVFGIATADDFGCGPCWRGYHDALTETPF